MTKMDIPDCDDSSISVIVCDESGTERVNASLGRKHSTIRSFHRSGLTKHDSQQPDTISSGSICLGCNISTGKNDSVVDICKHHECLSIKSNITDSASSQFSLSSSCSDLNFKFR